VNIMWKWIKIGMCIKIGFFIIDFGQGFLWAMIVAARG
jgi:hypothetical protein